MKLLEVLIERKVQSLNRPFSYTYKGQKTVGEGYRVLITFAKQQIVGYVVKCTDFVGNIIELEAKQGFKIEEIIDVIDDKPLLNGELIKLSKQISQYYQCPEIAVLQTMLPPSLKPSHTSINSPKIAYDSYVKVIDNTEENLTKKQIELLRFLETKKLYLKSDCKSQTVLNNLVKLNKVKIEKNEKRRLKLQYFGTDEKKTLTNEQKIAVSSILKNEKTVTLLQGVTGSGKTEVYLQLTEQILNENKTVLMLVPEIALTSRMIECFEKRFSGKIAILHSELTSAEKYDEYRFIAKNECKIVIGTRSAIFAPLSNIGLIILDEEHVESYKQDNMPNYHARDIAIMRAENNNAKVLLGSATPSLETKARAFKGVYNFVNLADRINKKELPKTYIVDLSKGSSWSRESMIFSKFLIEEIKDRLDKKEQVILLINRRGYSNYVSCRNCGHIFICPNCHIALTYHKEDNSLKCHHCGHTEQLAFECPECGSKYMSKMGFGTERIENEINKLFPFARVIRLDSDTGEKRNNIQRQLIRFANHEADILVGTQMVAKGHDFPNVTLVGIVLADIGLSLPSFRSSERTFQLITQAIGRSGRAEKEGEAIIQTFNPSHYAITLAAKQNYEDFFLKEMSIRKIQQYPPYTYLCSIDLSGKNEQLINDVINKIIVNLKQSGIGDLSIIGPVKPYILYEKNNYHKVILLKYKNSDKINAYLNRLTNLFKTKSQINLRINIDPYDF